MDFKSVLYKAREISLAVGTLAMLTLAGCGGGGSAGTPAAGTPVTGTAVHISGTAAAGAPVVGYVSVTDSSHNAQPVKTNIPIDANGNYTVDVTGLTPPFAFVATGTVGGKQVTLYSAATSADVGGTINITPFTDLMLRNIAATAVDAYLANPANVANLTSAQIDAQRVALTTALTPALNAMGLSGSIDLLRAVFSANSTGLDRFMDLVKVDTTNPAAVTITNILDAANTLVIDTTASTAALATNGTTLGTANLAPNATPFDKMLAGITAFSSKFATGLPGATDPALTGMLDVAFMQQGLNGSAWLTQLTTNPIIIGITFKNLVVDSIDPVTNIALIHFSAFDKSGTLLSVNNTQMKLDATSGNWLLYGDQHYVKVSIQTYALKGTCNPLSTSCLAATPNFSVNPEYQTGLNINIDNSALQPVGTALVTGPGLPVAGLTLAENSGETFFRITDVNPIPCINGVNFLCNLQYWQMSDTDIAAVTPGSVYTVTVNDVTNTTVIDTYTITVPVAPVLNASLATMSFPSITGMVNLVGIGATTLTPSWSVPAGLTANGMDIYLWQPSTGASLGIWNTNLIGTSGTTSFAVTAPPAGGTWDGFPFENYEIQAADQYGGLVITHYQ